MRGIIPVMVLIELEKSIKEHIIENRDTLVPADIRDGIQSVDDFDVNLVDYFDLVAGTSVGSWIACYIAARGRGTETFLKDPEVVANYGNIRPGCVEATRATFGVLSPRVFRSSGFLPQIITSLFRPAFPADRLKESLTTMFGETTMDDLETNCLIMAYDLKRNAACSFLRRINGKEKNYFVRTSARQRPRTSAAFCAAASNHLQGKQAEAENLVWSPDLAFDSGKNYRLRDITQASSSLPAAFPPARITPVNVRDPEELVLVDGGVVASNPTLQALTYIPSTFSSGDIRDVAIFSVGCGMVELTDELDPNPGILWWMQSGRLLNAFGVGTSECIQAAMDYWLYGNIGLPFGQYVRVQISEPEYTEDGQILSGMDNVDDLSTLERIGSRLAETNAAEIKRYVSDYIFGSTS